MASPTFFSDGNTPRKTDTQWTILQKILGATIDGGGGGGGGASLTTGVGAPTGATPTTPPFYWDTATSFFYVYDGAAWNIH